MRDGPSISSRTWAFGHNVQTDLSLYDQRPIAHPPRRTGLALQSTDLISAVEFDGTGDYLATGDHGGRVVLFERLGMPGREDGPEGMGGGPRGAPHEYRYLTEFQSHEPEFDYLKSLEIEEKINCVRWVRRGGGWGEGLETPTSHMLLTSNDKTIKLWRVAENPAAGRGDSPIAPPTTAHASAAGHFCATGELRVPSSVRGGGQDLPLLSHRCKRVFSSAHAYHINSVSMSSDQETMLSADDLRINLWHLDMGTQAFNVVDIKPVSMEDLTEVITRAVFHPRDGATFAYSSSRGCVRVGDLRAAALCDEHAKVLEDGSGAGGAGKTFFSEIIASINDLVFSSDGRSLVTRDFMTVKVWDLAMERSPVAIYPVHDSLRVRLAELYESDAIFDKFDVALSGDGRRWASGSYSSFFRVTDCVPGGEGQEERAAAAPSALLETSRDPLRRRAVDKGQARFGAGRGRSPGTAEESLGEDLSSKILRLSWHPRANVIATAAANSLYLFHAPGPTSE
ncbi:hypothetical protein H632_c247p1 [Helicosporidium sp. ATCC 50920]|nr:hypothetical protein H632_c247p1 [Helicosporidium sp. ATCC 50920]|eukprot:KDD76384.1 hypothetical protein H632_c247p1 [Helicosporidium sp. ATCC 50920]